MLSLISAAIGAVGSVFKFFANRQVYEAGKSDAIAASLQDQLNADKIAKDARDAAIAANMLDAGSVSDDGFKRAE